MDLHEQAFLSAALGAGDERLERRLLVGFHLIRECCRIADDPTWVPRVAVAKAMMDQAIVDGVFVRGDLELPALISLLEALDTNAPRRPAICSALVAYAKALYREASFSAALTILDVLDRSWTHACHPRDRLEAAYYQGLILIRGQPERGAGTFLPILLALRARAAHEPEYIALAGALRHVRTLLSGNLPRVLAEGVKRLRQLPRHPSVIAEGTFIHNVAAAHGRAGRPHEVLRYAKRVLDARYPAFNRFGALNLIGVALTELGDLGAAQAAFEMLLLAPESSIRRIGALGLMDIHARRAERDAFERIHRYLIHQPLPVEGRIYFWQVAGRGWAKLGDITQARESFDQAYAIARQYGLGFEILETEELLDTLPSPAQVARAADIAPEVAAYVTALRDSHAGEIAACMA